jgi:hypothetical protein
LFCEPAHNSLSGQPQSLFLFKLRNGYQFVDAGGNLLVGVNDELSENVRHFAESCGVEYDTKGTQVIDHFLNEMSLDER